MYECLADGLKCIVALLLIASDSRINEAGLLNQANFISFHDKASNTMWVMPNHRQDSLVSVVTDTGFVSLQMSINHAKHRFTFACGRNCQCPSDVMALENLRTGRNQFSEFSELRPEAAD